MFETPPPERAEKLRKYPAAPHPFVIEPWADCRDVGPGETFGVDLVLIGRGQSQLAYFIEALRRGASYYLPGLSVPMLPRALSEGLVSIGPDVDRRALIFDVEFDGRGTVTKFGLERARVRSRGKLTFDGVQAFVDGKAKVPGPRAIGPSLLAIAALGELRCKHEDRAQMVRYLRPETTVRLDAAGQLVVSSAPRTAIELANEQISILCNALGGRFLQGGSPELVQPIYRVHEPPEADRIAGFERLVAQVARQRGLPDDPWLYRRAADQGMAGYLQHLPTTGPGGRLARALHRQAMLLNGRSVFAAEPRAHFGVGEQIYSRFTAPMREIVGIQCHAQAIDRMLGKSPRSRDEDEAIRLANDVQYGLTGYVWTNDVTRALRVTEQLEAGMIWVNSENVRHLPTPFGGVKASGYGRFGGKAGIDAFTELRWITVETEPGHYPI